jgi:hypothetical protein
MELSPDTIEILKQVVGGIAVLVIIVVVFGKNPNE